MKRVIIHYPKKNVQFVVTLLEPEIIIVNYVVKMTHITGEGNITSNFSHIIYSKLKTQNNNPM